MRSSRWPPRTKLLLHSLLPLTLPSNHPLEATSSSNSNVVAAAAVVVVAVVGEAGAEVGVEVGVVVGAVAVVVAGAAD